MLKELTSELHGQVGIITWQDQTNGADYDPILDEGTENEIEKLTGYGKGRVRVTDQGEEELFEDLRSQLIEYRSSQENK